MKFPDRFILDLLLHGSNPAGKAFYYKRMRLQTNPAKMTLAGRDGLFPDQRKALR
jgi:hypothetical protein